MSDGFYLSYDQCVPSLEVLHRFWLGTLQAANLIDTRPWTVSAGSVEQLASSADLDLELAIYLADDGTPQEVSLEGHWSRNEGSAAFRAIVDAAGSFARDTGGRLESFDWGAAPP